MLDVCVRAIRITERAGGVLDEAWREAYIKGNNLVEFQGLAVLGEFKIRRDKADRFQLAQMHLQQSAADTEFPSQSAHIVTTARQRGDDANPMRAGQRSQYPHQVLTRR